MSLMFVLPLVRMLLLDQVVALTVALMLLCSYMPVAEGDDGATATAEGGLFLMM